MSGECCETDASYDSKSNEINDYASNECGDAGQQLQHEDSKLQEMGEALEVAESRCNTLKEQLDQMRHLYRERSTSKPTSQDSKTMEHKQQPKSPILRQNADAITTDNSGAAVLTINNILNGITNSINRLSELHSYIEPEPPYSACRKSKHTKTQENVSTYDARNTRFSASRSSSWIFNDKKKEQKKRSKLAKPRFEYGSMTQIKKSAIRTRISSAREEASTTSVKGRKKNKRTAKPVTKVTTKRPGFNNNLSSNHLVEIYHNTAVDDADSEEMIHGDNTPEHRNQVRPVQIDHRNKYNRKQVQMPTISTTHCKESEATSHAVVRSEGYRSLSPIKEHETNIQVIQQQEAPYQSPYYCNRSYQSPTISSKMKQVARSYFRHFSCKSIPFCAAKSTGPSHNIGINIQQVMSIINGRQHNRGISPTLAHNIGLAAERLNNTSFTALVSSFGSRYRHPNVACPMQCNINYQHLQEMATDVPNDDMLGGDTPNDIQKNKIEIEIANRKSQEALCWSIDPMSHNNCTCETHPGIGFQEVVDKYQTYAPSTEYMQHSLYSFQHSMYAQKVQKQSNKKYSHIRSVYAQYNDANREKKDTNGEFSAGDGNFGYPMQGKEKVLKSVLINLHNEFAELSDKYDDISNRNSEEQNSSPEQIEKMESLEKKLNEKEIEIQMVMSLYSEVVNLKAELKSLKDNVGISTDILQNQKRRMKLLQNNKRKYQRQPPQEEIYYANCTNNSGDQQIAPQKGRETKPTGSLYLERLLKHIQSYRDVCKNGAK